MTSTYILVGDSQAVGMENMLRRRFAPYNIVALGASVRVGVSTFQLTRGEGPPLPQERRRGVRSLTPVSPTVDELVALNPGFVIVVLGGNDRIGAGGTAAYARIVRDMVEHLQRPLEGGPRRPVIWIGPGRVRVDSATSPVTESMTVGDHPPRYYRIRLRQRGIDTNAQADDYNRAVARMKQRIKGVQESTIGRINGAHWYDGFAMTRGKTHANDGVHFNRDSKEHWARQIVNVVRGQQLPQRAHPPDGSYVSSVPQVASNNRVNASNRTAVTQSSPRSGLYNARTGADAVRRLARASAQSRRIDYSQRDLRLPVIVNALGFDYTERMWVSTTSTNSNATAATVAELTVPDVSETEAPDETPDGTEIDPQETDDE